MKDNDFRSERNISDKLWNRNFLLLWQGQLVSALGDVVYEIALGFWVLAVTGSTALMGTLMAVTMLPRVILGPFAGVWVDRLNRKWILVTADAVRGFLILLVATAAFAGKLEIWMVFSAGISIGLGGAFFNPATTSMIPDLVSKDNLMKGNSAFSMIRAGTGIIGNAAGGFLFQILGAPLMFLVNGISYVLSAFSEVFISLPCIERQSIDRKFGDDLKDGFRFVWKEKGLRMLIITAACINFFSGIAVILILPLFQRNPDLGAGKYGLGISALTAGMVFGMIILSTLKTKASGRFVLFLVASVAMSIFWALFPLVPSFPVMLACAFLGGFGNAIVNVIIQTVLQITTPRNMRGKVFSILETIAGSITPIAMALGGILGELLPLEIVISGSFGLTLLSMLPMFFSGNFRTYICSDIEPESD